MSDYELKPFTKGDEILLKDGTEVVYVKSYLNRYGIVMVKIAMDGDARESTGGPKKWVSIDHLDYDYVQHVKWCKKNDIKPTIKGFYQLKNAPI